MYIQVKLKTSEEEKKTVETRLQVAQKDLATIRERESKLSSEKVMVILYISWLTVELTRKEGGCQLAVCSSFFRGWFLT